MYDPDNADRLAEEAGDRPIAQPDLAERTRRVRLEAKALATAVGHTVGEAESLLRDQLSAKPYAVIGIAAGIGYILGGGLSGRLAVVLTGIAGRAMLNRLVRNALDARAHIAR